MADVDAATHSLSVLEPFRYLDKPGQLQAGGVLEKDDGTVWPLAQARVELAQHGKQAACLCSHLTFVVHDQAGHAACESAGESRDHVTARLVQEIDAAVQVDHRQVRMRRHEGQNMLQLVRCAGVHLGGQAQLREAEPSQPEQRIVACDAPLE